MPILVPNAIKQAFQSIKPERQQPLWHGPCAEGWLGGTTQSMIGRYISCPERFRIQYMEGLRPIEKFNAPTEYGDMWHECEQALAEGKPWIDRLDDCRERLHTKYPFSRADVDMWSKKVEVVFPIYIDHWAEHPDVKVRSNLLSEQVFDVKYRLPSGRYVRLRGKYDSVDLIDDYIWLVENKTKSGIDEYKILKQMRMDLQTLLYIISLHWFPWKGFDAGAVPKVRGVKYNVVRRPLHKSIDSMLNKIKDDRDSNRLGEWFSRWDVEVSEQDIERFRKQCLDPVLENMCDDFEWWNETYSTGQVWDMATRRKFFPHHAKRHYRVPYGIYSSVMDGGFGDVDSYLETGTTVGLRRDDRLFGELKDEQN